MNEASGFTELKILLWLLIGFSAYIIFYLEFLVPFLKERKNIKLEIERSTGEELQYWERRLKILYIYSIPIIGYIVRKINEKQG